MTRKTTHQKEAEEAARRYAETFARRNEEICRLYAAYLADPITGWTLEKIADKYGLTKQRVWKIWKRYNPD